MYARMPPGPKRSEPKRSPTTSPKQKASDEAGGMPKLGSSAGKGKGGTKNKGAGGGGGGQDLSGEPASESSAVDAGVCGGGGRGRGRGVYACAWACL